MGFWCRASDCSGVPCRICNFYMGMAKQDISGICRRNDISAQACSQLINAILKKRWLVYLYFWIFIAFIWLSWLLGRKWKRKFPLYWKNGNLFNALTMGHALFHEVVSLFEFRNKKVGDEALRKSIQDLFNSTTYSNKMCKGYDGEFQSHKSFEVLKVERIEDARIWRKYTGNRLMTPRVKQSLQKLK